MKTPGPVKPRAYAKYFVAKWPNLKRTLSFLLFDHLRCDKVRHIRLVQTMFHITSISLNETHSISTTASVMAISGNLKKQSLKLSRQALKSSCLNKDCLRELKNFTQKLNNSEVRNEAR